MSIAQRLVDVSVESEHDREEGRRLDDAAAPPPFAVLHLKAPPDDFRSANGGVGVRSRMMWTSNAGPRCTQCQEPIEALDDLGVCIICAQLFCGRHLVTRDGVDNCHACDEVRRRQEDSSPVSQADAGRVVRLLTRDLVATLGEGYEAVVEEAAARIRLFASDAADFEQRVVDDVQQDMHNLFVDTAWPRCPDHPNHPLWYSGSWWQCSHSGRRAAPLGGLQRRAGG